MNHIVCWKYFAQTRRLVNVCISMFICFEGTKLIGGCRVNDRNIVYDILYLCLWKYWPFKYHYLNLKYTFFIRGSTCMAIASYTSPPLPLFSFLSLPSRQRFPHWEFDLSDPLLCCIVFARGRRETAENLCWYSRQFNSLPSVYSLWKNDLPRSVFRCVGRG